MSNDNESVNGFTKPASVIINDLPDLSHNKNEIGVLACEITVNQMLNLGVFLKSLESVDLNESLKHQYKTACGIYESLRNRLNRNNGQLANSTKLIRALTRDNEKLTKIIDNTLDDLEAIYKDTGLDSEILEKLRSLKK